MVIVYGLGAKKSTEGAIGTVLPGSINMSGELLCVSISTSFVVVL